MQRFLDQFAQICQALNNLYNVGLLHRLLNQQQECSTNFPELNNEQSKERTRNIIRQGSKHGRVTSMDVFRCGDQQGAA